MIGRESSDVNEPVPSITEPVGDRIGRVCFFGFIGLQFAHTILKYASRAFVPGDRRFLPRAADSPVATVSVVPVPGLRKRARDSSYQAAEKAMVGALSSRAVTFFRKLFAFCLYAAASAPGYSILLTAISSSGEDPIMRIAAIYDIHANLSALEAVLQEIRQAEVDRIIVGGDVLPGPLPRETIQCLLELDIPAQFLHGNGDREVLAQLSGVETDWYRTAPEQWREPVRWTAQQLHTQHQRLLAGWPPTCRIEVPGLGDILFCHATPRNDTEIFTRLTPKERLLPIFEGLGVAVVVCGHTHMQFDRMIGTIRVVNAGSVGMPFGNPGADWLLLDPDVQLRHTRYDLARAADRIRSTRYPQAEDFAARNILQPPSEEETLAAFTRAELK